MAVIAELATWFTARTEKFEAGVRRAEAAAVAFSSRVASSIGTGMARVGQHLTKAATRFAKFGATLGVTGVGAGLTWGFKLAMDAEQAQVAFEMMTGSAENAKKMLEDIERLAARTPLRQQELILAAQTLLAMETPVENIVDELVRLGDLSAFMPITLGELAEIMGKMRSTQIIQREELNQLIGRGINVLPSLAEQLGVSGKKNSGLLVREMATEGKVSFEMLQTAIETMTGEGGTFNKAMERLSTTTGGRLSTAIDNVAITLRGIAEKLITEFKVNERLEQFSNWLSENREMVTTSVTTFITTFVETLKTIGTHIKELTAAVLRLAGIMDPLPGTADVYEHAGRRYDRATGREVIPEQFEEVVPGLRMPTKEWEQHLRHMRQERAKEIVRDLSLKARQSLSPFSEGGILKQIEETEKARRELEKIRREGIPLKDLQPVNIGP